MNTNPVQLDSTSTLSNVPGVSNPIMAITDDGNFQQTLRDASATEIDSPQNTSSAKYRDKGTQNKTSGNQQESAVENSSAASSGKSPAKASDQASPEEQSLKAATGDGSDQVSSDPKSDPKKEEETGDAGKMPLTLDPGLILKAATAEDESLPGSLDATLGPQVQEDESLPGSLNATLDPQVPKVAQEADSAVSLPTQAKEPGNDILQVDTETLPPAAESAKQGKIAANEKTAIIPGDTGKVDKAADSLKAALANQPLSQATERNSMKEKSEETPAPVSSSDVLHSGKKGKINLQAFQKEAGNNAKNDTQLLNDQKPLMETDTAQKETVNFQSLITKQDNGTPAKELSRSGHPLDSANPVNEANGGHIHVSHLQDQAAARSEAKISHDMKPHQVFERSVMDQIVTKASLISRDGKNEMHIQLDPPSLGSVKIEVSVKGENVTAKLVADNHVARDILERNLPQLKNSFTDHGLKVDQMSVNVGNDPRQQAADYFRPFYMERGYSQGHAGGPESEIQPGGRLPSGIHTGRTESGGISVFA